MGDVAKSLQSKKRINDDDEDELLSDVGHAAVEELLASLQLERPPKAQHDAPEWPKNLADLSDDELGEHMAYWSAMVAYAAFHAALHATDRKIYEWKRGKEFNDVFVGVYDSNVTVARAQAESDAVVMAADEKHFKSDLRYHLLQAVQLGFEQKYLSISREITRRMSQRERKV